MSIKPYHYDGKNCLKCVYCAFTRMIFQLITKLEHVKSQLKLTETATIIIYI